MPAEGTRGHGSLQAGSRKAVSAVGTCPSGSHDLVLCPLRKCAAVPGLRGGSGGGGNGTGESGQ
eukprot:10794323-Lingulodinium_polyedra.AAC.1